MRRFLLIASASALTAALVSLPISVDLGKGGIVAASALAKDGGNGNGGGNGGGQGNGNGGGHGNGNGGSSGGGSSGGSSNGGGSSSGNSGGAGAANGNSGSAAGGTSVGSDTEAGVDSSVAVSHAQERLGAAEQDLAAARQALAETLTNGDDMKIAVARGRVAGAAYAVSSAEMDVTAAQAGIGDIETAAE